LNTHYQVVQVAKNKIDFLQLYRIDSAYYPALLETVLSDNKQKHYDILFLDPGQSIVLDHRFQLSFDAKDHGETLLKQDFLSLFNQQWETAKYAEEASNSYPFRGGWFVYLAYELAQQIEPVLNLPRSSTNLPVAYASRFKSALIYDHLKNETVLVSESDVEQSVLLKKIKADIQTANKFKSNPLADFTALQEDEPNAYLSSVAKIKQYIADGDVFQVNLSRQWNMPILESDHQQLAVSLYRNLRIKNPAPFAGLVTINGSSIISSSPERLVKVSQGIMESRPIAGTRPRSENAQQDQEYLQQLHAHPKEKAEHIMLIDLIRNDLGRVCQPGSIEANELMVNESYAHVHHIVSNVRGKLKQGVLPGDVIAAIFPGGTITGCPKVRCMEIIAEQEQVARNAYTGSMGYINNDGSMDLNILIRSMILDTQGKGQQLSFRAGAGLVADSDPEHELKETKAKALGLLKVFQ